MRSRELAKTEYRKDIPALHRYGVFDDVERLIDTFFGRTGGTYPWVGGFEAAYAVPIDLYEEKDYLVVRAEVPGIKREDISVSVSGNTLLISGEKKRDETVEKEGYYKCETVYGTFSRSVTLPEWADTENIDAAYHDGILELRIPKTEKEYGLKKIEIH
ncbi:MAG TPA: Hsp20/alpha crystallin family protein [Verrucomicrobiae bacterium]|nr:Hsp20/alpha crystallin family protein [Verrucomicrobiae bacterium]